MDQDEIVSKYKVTEDFLIPMKKILIIGATGKWGGHFSIGMALASHSDLVLVDYIDKEDDMDKLLDDIHHYELSITIDTYLMTSEEITDREVFYKKMKMKFGPFASIMDVEGIN